MTHICVNSTARDAADRPVTAVRAYSFPPLSIRARPKNGWRGSAGVRPGIAVSPSPQRM
ncbi:hypothetical protein ACWC09_18655 [Streptomyces sp. NPDC001617]